MGDLFLYVAKLTNSVPVFHQVQIVIQKNFYIKILGTKETLKLPTKINHNKIKVKSALYTGFGKSLENILLLKNYTVSRNDDFQVCNCHNSLRHFTCWYDSGTTHLPT